MIGSRPAPSDSFVATRVDVAVRHWPWGSPLSANHCFAFGCVTRTVVCESSAFSRSNSSTAITTTTGRPCLATTTGSELLRLADHVPQNEDLVAADADSLRLQRAHDAVGAVDPVTIS
jgi:hypothetical protein